MESKIVYDIFHLFTWDWRIALDLFLGSLGIGAFLYAFFVLYRRSPESSSLLKIASVLAPVAVGVGLLAMLSELGHPLRIYKTFLFFNSTSILSWGGLLQQLFLLFSVIFAYLVVFDKAPGLVGKVGILAAFSAVSVAFYHGFLLSFATARPLWNAGASTVVSLASLATGGIAAVLLVGSLSQEGKREIAGIAGNTKNILIVSLFIQLVAVLIWAVSLATGKADFVAALGVLYREFGLLFWGVGVAVGLVAPLILLATRKARSFPVVLSSLLILVGGFVFRYVFILCGQIS